MLLSADNSASFAIFLSASQFVSKLSFFDKILVSLFKKCYK
ncbi:hypothetical protein AB33_4426 [Escherichia coli 2-427-07_S1_C2]|nr:hypothetical protein AC90_4657 [Escherichia coli 3-475-03_S4_C1]KDT98115.1 hypothetical protein AB46_4878 [Escherichia coli 3-267-03_S1_C2]KDY21676.1 hypothetical protein AB33_4426 [Escherichia coli 2-427-07_S1_C2]